MSATVSTDVWLGLATILAGQVGKLIRDVIVGRRRDARLQDRLDILETLAAQAAADAASANRKAWRLTHPGAETPDPTLTRTNHGQPIPRPPNEP